MLVSPMIPSTPLASDFTRGWTPRPDADMQFPTPATHSRRRESFAGPVPAQQTLTSRVGVGHPRPSKASQVISVRSPPCRGPARLRLSRCPSSSRPSAGGGGLDPQAGDLSPCNSASARLPEFGFFAIQMGPGNVHLTAARSPCHRL